MKKRDLQASVPCSQLAGARWSRRYEPLGSNYHDHRCQCPGCDPDPDDYLNYLEYLAQNPPRRKRWEDISIQRHGERGTFDIVDKKELQTLREIPLRLYIPALCKVRERVNNWYLSAPTDPRARLLADRHYSRQTPFSRRFVAPGECIVLLTDTADALWVSLRQKYIKHAWDGAWNCTLFRNESARVSSHLIHQAVAITRHFWGDPPEKGMITFVNPAKVLRRRDFGRCYLKAGWHQVACTRQSRLLVFQIPPEEMPAPQPPASFLSAVPMDANTLQLSLFPPFAEYTENQLQISR